ncbi:2-succinyl-5-enolpyruvyl-6-hydroxy-3-cyclohexene-1-carboxylic-acid synthase [bacterium]|nr:2-succinyl-5-enolpyruvyl-6-hydroxy-3-cyclohexene-1-carboxylic-acid synthase [bacterium]
MKNAQMVQKSLEWMWSTGVREICVCPGGRNSPFVVALENESHFRVHVGFDERATGFFALGLAQSKRRPVAVIVTSGTAVAELLPAVMEAFYTQTPLIIVSADRPRRMRGTGAPQTVDQVGLFNQYVEKCVDMEDEFLLPSWSQSYAIHLNICFDEPLLDGPVIWSPPANSNSMDPHYSSASDLQNSWNEFRKKSQRAIVIVSTLTSLEEREAVRAWLARWSGWVYAEGTSGLREIDHPGMIMSGDRRVQQMLQGGEVDSVIRLGGVPTARAWRNLEKLELPVFSLSQRPFAGLSRGSSFFASLGKTLPQLHPPLFDEKFFISAKEKDFQFAEQKQKLLDLYPQSEPALFYQLSKQIAQDTARGTVYVGNSLPIREWDGFAMREQEIPLCANRGANGIDGQLSTALGFLQKQKTLWVILGDLTTLYDSNALWFWQKSKEPMKLVVVNNSGGKIFERLFHKKIFYNEHNIHFSEWAKQWDFPPTNLIELVPSEEQTKAFWAQYDRLWETAK